MKRAYIYVDAVDELLPQNRSEFLRALRQVVQEASNARLFLTGRTYIRGQCSEPSGGPAGDGGDNAKRAGRVAQDRTASRSPV